MDLGLDDEEAFELAGALGHPIDEATAAMLNRHAEGWSAGLHLGILAIADPREATASDMAGDSDTIADYLRSEILEPLGPDLVAFLRRFKHELPDYAERDTKDAVRFTLLVKFAPGLPAFAKNYMLGLSGVPLAVYFLLSMLINGVYAVLFVVLGESLLEHDLRGIALPVAVLVLAALCVAVWYGRRSRPVSA